MGFATRWFGLRKNLGEEYTPLYALAALGNGGMAVAFFIWLNFLVPHPKTPIITFDVIAAFLPTAATPIQVLILSAMAAIIFFGTRHLRLLFWNIREYLIFRRTAAFTRLRQSNAEFTLLGIPLALTMTVNMAFAAGAVLTPGLWNVVEYLFPVAMAAFLILGIWDGKIMLDFLGRVLSKAEFECSHNNSLSQLKSSLAFAMVAVGFAAPAAMSVNRLTVTLSIIGATFFGVIGVLLLGLLMVLGFRSMLRYGIHIEHAVSLWTPLPILTVLAVMTIRISKGLTFLFSTPAEGISIVALRNQSNPEAMLILTAVMVSMQLILGFLGYAVMKRVGYFRTYVSGATRSPGSYALVCPGTGVFVLGMFFIHTGLIQTGLLPRYSVAHIAMIIPFALAQLYAIVTMLRLDSKLIRPTLAQPEGIEAVAA
ncbi:MAG: hypothetical protein HGA19_19505 [Oscillochloris sp.]|nr:hypothetical protein [Oscillochloris sp.]